MEVLREFGPSRRPSLCLPNLVGVSVGILVGILVGIIVGFSVGRLSGHLIRGFEKGLARGVGAKHRIVFPLLVRGHRKNCTEKRSERLA